MIDLIFAELPQGRAAVARQTKGPKAVPNWLADSESADAEREHMTLGCVDAAQISSMRGVIYAARRVSELGYRRVVRPVAAGRAFRARGFRGLPVGAAGAARRDRMSR